MKYDKDIKRRLRRVEGQVRGVLNMMEEGAACKDVVNQLAAIRHAVDRALAYVVAMNLERCLAEDGASDEKDRRRRVQEAVELLIKSR